MVQFSSLYSAYLDEELHSADSTVLFTTARRQAAINKGQAEFADLTECFQKQSSVTLTGGTQEYDLNTVITATDFVRFSKEQVRFQYTDATSNVTVLAGDDLPRKDIDWLNRYRPAWNISTLASTTQQYPEFYYLRPSGGALYLGFTPIPSTGSSASMEAIVPYVAKPALLTNDTSEPFSNRWDLRMYHQALVHYAAHQLEKLRPDDQASDRQFQKFMSYVARYVSASRVKGGQTLTMARQYFSRAHVTVKDPRT